MKLIIIFADGDKMPIPFGSERVYLSTQVKDVDQALNVLKEKGELKLATKTIKIKRR